MNDDTQKPKRYSPAWLNALSPEDRAKELTGIFGNSIHRDGSSHVTWIYFTRGSKILKGAFGHDQGSMFILDCGSGPFAVTADHVYEGYLSLRDQGKLAGFQIANIEIDLTERLISRGGRKIDIATFSLTDSEIADIGKKVLRSSPNLWPPMPPNENESVFFCGYPAAGTMQPAFREVNFGLYSALCPVTTVTDHQITCRFDPTSRVDSIGNGLPPVGNPPGGVSGGPLLVPDYGSASEVWEWRLGGVVSEAHASQDFEIITAIRAHYIQPNGQIG